MRRRSIFVAISILSFLGAAGALVRGQYLSWEAARLEFASEHADAHVIDLEPRRKGFLLDASGPETEAMVKRNAVSHHRTLAAILSGAGVLASYWAWARYGPRTPVANTE